MRPEPSVNIAGHGQLFRLISRLISMSRLLTDVADLAGYAEVSLANMQGCSKTRRTAIECYFRKATGNH